MSCCTTHDAAWGSCNQGPTAVPCSTEHGDDDVVDDGDDGGDDGLQVSDDSPEDPAADEYFKQILNRAIYTLGLSYPIPQRTAILFH